ncbi:MAG: ABC transporter permease subunit [Candidatus Rokubacteria bacterium]|nr:ABC transporter permease subunit [Candidatus Rokubacteria bacterium]
MTATRSDRRRSPAPVAWRRLTYAILLGYAAFAVTPLLWVLTTAVKSPAEAQQVPPALLPSSFHLENFRLAFTSSAFGPWPFVNSAVYAGGTVALGMVVASLAGFAFSRFRFRGAGALFLALVLANLMPSVAKLVPLYLLYSAARLYDTRIGLVLLFTLGVVPLGTWMMKGYFDRIPRELEESALLDGCTPLGAFARVTVPLAAPGLAALAVIAFVDAWNAFTFPLILTERQALKPYTVAVYSFVGEYGEVQWPHRRRDQDVTSPWRARGRPWIIAHRGASHEEPENTLRAFERAVERGADLIELDVHLSRDGAVVVIHDERVEQTTSGRGAVRELTLAELSRLDAGRGERIPTLAEVVERLAGRCGFYVELKAAGTPAAVLEVVHRGGVAGDVILGSFRRTLIQEARGLDPGVPTSLLVGAGNDPVGAARAAGAAYVHLCWERRAPNPADLVTPDLLAGCRRAGLGVILWHEERAEVIARLRGLPVDGVCSNRPELLLGLKATPGRP